MARKKPSSGPKPGELEFEAPILELDKRIRDLEKYALSQEVDLEDEIKFLRLRADEMKREIFDGLSAWERVLVARHPERPSVSDFAKSMVDDFCELHGDRAFGDDYAILTGLAKIDNLRFLLIGHRKGKSTQERIKANFGSAHPEGYRKALEKMRLAEKFNLPIVCLVNTPGAYPGIGAEERGQAAAIARNIYEMFSIKVPIIVIITGEGGSGGALGIGIGDRVWTLQNSYYSVISPEGCAAILWRDGNAAPEAASALKLTPGDLLKFGIIDEIIPEPLGGAHRNPQEMSGILRKAIFDTLNILRQLPIGELLKQRHDKFRRIGRFLEKNPAEIKAELAAKAAADATRSVDDIAASAGIAGIDKNETGGDIPLNEEEDESE